MRRFARTLLSGLLLLAVPWVGAAGATGNERTARPASVCYGTPADGALKAGCKLPALGENFEAYSGLGHLMGRTWLNCDAADAIVDAYATLATTRPENIYVYGETGKAEGGPFSPHKTHQNGPSADFMVPVVDREGRSAVLPGSLFNKWGYELAFDDRGRLDELTIDFEVACEPKPC